MISPSRSAPTQRTTALTLNRTTGQASFAKIVASGDVEVSGDTWRTSRATVAAAAAWAQFIGRRARGTLGASAAVLAGDSIYSFTLEPMMGRPICS